MSIESGGEVIGYLMEAETFEALRSINTRLYDDRPLTGDERRDLANKMQAVMWQIMPHR